MKKIILPIAAMLVLSGCFQYKRTTVFNPDGSGKMLLETQLQKGSLLVDDGDDNESMKKAVAVFIKNCRGLEAWTDVKYKINDENSVDFKGTCYFRDISKIKLYNISASEITFNKLKNGDIEIAVLKGEKKDKEENSILASKPKKINPDKIDEEAAKQRAQYKKIRPLFAGIFGVIDHEDIISVKGEVKEYKNLEKLQDGSYRYVFQGEEIMKAIDALMLDDKGLKNLLLDKGAVMSAGFGSLDILQNLKGKLEKSVVLFKPVGPAFDYESETAGAKKDSEKITAELEPSKQENRPVVEAAKDGSFKTARLAEINLKNYDIKLKDRYGRENCCEVTFQGGFEGSVVNVKNVELQKAVSDTGVDLARKNWGTSPSLSENKSSVTFTLHLLPLPKDALGFAELSGKCKVLTGSETKTLDPGFKELKAGAEGTELGVKIISIKRSDWPSYEYIDGVQKEKPEKDDVIEFEFKINADLLKSAKLIKKDGKEVKLTQHHSWAGENSSTIGYTVDGKAPPDAKVALEIYKDMKEYNVPFKFENVKLTDFTGGELEPKKDNIKRK